MYMRYTQGQNEECVLNSVLTKQVPLYTTQYSRIIGCRIDREKHGCYTLVQSRFRQKTHQIRILRKHLEQG